jgi:multiple sugar transport system substrate-binding protein
MATQSVFYNKKLFKQAGVPYPKAGWTLEDFTTAAKKLTIVKNGRIEQWGALLPGDYLRGGLEYMFAAYGARFLSPDGKTANGYLNSPQGEQALQDYLNLYKLGISPTATQANGFGNIDLFQTGRVAMQWTGMWNTSMYLQDPNLSFDTVPMPIGATGKQASVSYIGGYAINAKTQHLPEAATLLGFFGSQEWAQIDSYVATPALKGRVAADLVHREPVLKAFIDQSDALSPAPEPQTLNWSKDVSPALTNLIDNMIVNPDLDLHQQIQQTVSQIDANLAETYAEQ